MGLGAHEGGSLDPKCTTELVKVGGEGRPKTRGHWLLKVWVVSLCDFALLCFAVVVFQIYLTSINFIVGWGRSGGESNLSRQLKVLPDANENHMRPSGAEAGFPLCQALL